MTMSSYGDAYVALCEAVIAGRDVETMAAAFERFIASFGMSNYACGEIDLVERRRSMMLLVRWPQEWFTFYAASNLIETDPIFAALRRTDGPFSWTDLKQDGPNRADKRIFEAAAGFGWHEGFVIALPRGGNRRGLISLCGPSTHLPRSDYGALASGAALFYERALGLMTGTPVLYTAAGLTAREVECLAGAATGLSDVRIGEKLGISGATVHDHIERAKSRFGVRSRTAAVAVAVSMNLFQP